MEQHRRLESGTRTQKGSSTLSHLGLVALIALPASFAVLSLGTSTRHAIAGTAKSTAATLQSNGSVDAPAASGPTALTAKTQAAGLTPITVLARKLSGPGPAIRRLGENTAQLLDQGERFGVATLRKAADDGALLPGAAREDFVRLVAALAKVLTPREVVDAMRGYRPSAHSSVLIDAIFRSVTEANTPRSINIVATEVLGEKPGASAFIARLNKVNASFANRTLDSAVTEPMSLAEAVQALGKNLSELTAAPGGRRKQATIDQVQEAAKGVFAESDGLIDWADVLSVINDIEGPHKVVDSLVNYRGIPFDDSRPARAYPFDIPAEFESDVIADTIKVFFERNPAPGRSAKYYEAAAAEAIDRLEARLPDVPASRSLITFLRYQNKVEYAVQ